MFCVHIPNCVNFLSVALSFFCPFKSWALARAHAKYSICVTTSMFYEYIDAGSKFIHGDAMWYIQNGARLDLWFSFFISFFVLNKTNFGCFCFCRHHCLQTSFLLSSTILQTLLITENSICIHCNDRNPKKSRSMRWRCSKTDHGEDLQMSINSQSLSHRSQLSLLLSVCVSEWENHFVLIIDRQNAMKSYKVHRKWTAGEVYLP